MEKFDFKKSLGQNFLVDENIKNKIVNASSVKNGSIVKKSIKGKRCGL